MLNKLIKYGIAGLAGLTTLGALLVIVFIAIRPEGEAWWIIGRLLVAAYVVAMGVLTGLHLRTATPSVGRTPLLMLGAIWSRPSKRTSTRWNGSSNSPARGDYPLD